MCCSDCYAYRCLFDCFVISFCCPCRWCCGVPQTYEEDYVWAAYPDEMGRINRKVATKVHENKVAQKMGRRVGNGGRRVAANQGQKCQHDYWQSHGGGGGGEERSRSTNNNGGRRMSRRRSSGTVSTKWSMAEKSQTDTSEIFLNDPVMSSRDTTDLVPNEMPDDPIMSERTDYESHMSG